MSIYRNRLGPTSDVHAKPLRKDEPTGTAADQRADWQYETPANQKPETLAPVPPDILAKRNPQQPANVLLQHTVKWAERFPEDVRPVQLMRQYPRVANMLALLWDEPTRTQFVHYMEALLVDRRGNRRGFPPEVANDLLTLRSAYDERHRFR
jgi:hypothetical protein